MDIPIEDILRNETIEETLERHSGVDISYAPKILEQCDEEEITSNPILRFLNKESLESIFLDNSSEQIKKAYKKLGRIFHPDKNPDSSLKWAEKNSIFVLINHVYQKLIGGGKKELPFALDLQSGYPDMCSPDENIFDLCWATYCSQPMRRPSGGYGSYKYLLARKAPNAERDAHPDLPDQIMVIIYGSVAFQAHEWEKYHLTSVFLGNIVDSLDSDLIGWLPINKSNEEYGTISTSIKRSENGGVFLCPTAIAPKYVESVPGRLDSIFQIYSDYQGDGSELVSVPKDLATPFAGSLYLFGNSIICPWAYIDQLSLDRLVQQYNNYILEKDEPGKLAGH